MTTGARLYVLLVEDEPTDAALVKRHLSSRFLIEWVDSGKGLMDKAGHGRAPDVILLDLRMPDSPSDSVAFVFQVCQAFPDSAVVVLTGLDDQGLAFASRQAGAKDYILKDAMISAEVENKVLFAYATKQAEVQERRRITARVNPQHLASSIREAVKSEIQASKHEPITVPEKLVELVRKNWKWIAGTISAASLYLVEIRDTITETAEAVRTNAAAVDALSQEIKRIDRDCARRSSGGR